jgi:hypothetical protein
MKAARGIVFNFAQTRSPAIRYEPAFAMVSGGYQCKRPPFKMRSCIRYAVTSPHPDQGLITALPMEVTAVVTAVSSDSVLWSL